MMKQFVIDGKEQMLNDYGSCPACGSSWDAGPIFDKLRPQDWCAHMSDDELHAHIAEFYGASKNFSRLIGIEIRGFYDGVSMWQCPDCKTRWNRFKDMKSPLATAT